MSEQNSQPGPRKEYGDAASSQRHPPHVDVNARGAPAQDSNESPADTPVLPANAHGADRQPNELQQDREIDPESMYDRRPGEDKDRAEHDMP
jgi:hypothetical protein